MGRYRGSKKGKFPTHTVYGKPIRNIFSNYIGLPYINLFDLVKDTSPIGLPDEVQCNYIYKDGHQCITLLNTLSIDNKSGFCNMHNDIELFQSYDSDDDLFRCSVHGYRNKKCRNKAYHKEVVNGKHVYLCPKHLKKYK